eukprot:6086588-Heterocapsa_arctica.AAC.1
MWYLRLLRLIRAPPSSSTASSFPGDIGNIADPLAINGLDDETPAPHGPPPYGSAPRGQALH